MTDLGSTFLKYAQRSWPSKRAAAALGVVLAAGTTLAFVEIDLSSISLAQWYFVGAVFFAPWIVWGFTVRLPRHRKGSLGFGVAIVFKDDDQKQQVRADFIDRMETLLRSHKTRHKFDFIEFPQRIARKIKDNASADLLLQRTRGHFLIRGTSRLREINGEPTHVLNLEGTVRHARVAQTVSNELAAEFSKIFPRQVLIGKENDLFKFEFTAQWVDVVTRYVVGVAALISGDIDYAEELFLGLEAQLQDKRGEGSPAIPLIRNRLPSRIGDVLKIRVERDGTRYQMSREHGHLEAVEGWLDRLERYDPGWYEGHLYRAIGAFVLRRDLQAAYVALENCTSVRDPTWRYSKAFLHAYEGDLKAAWEEYRPAFRRTLGDMSVPVQSEEFMHTVLDEEPDKGQLYFCLGMINRSVKCDLASARRDFAQFLSSTKQATFPQEHKLARRWIDQIDREMGTATEQ